MKIDGFMLAMLAAVALALVQPEWGATGGPLHLDVVTKIGIGVVFFLHGAALSPQALRSGAANWRLHLMVQGTTFLLFPLLGALIYFTAEPVLAPDLRLGFFYLCAISSTISSSVAMTAMAQGNVPAAVFNATLSGLIGMVVTPALVGLVSLTTAEMPPLSDSILDVFATLLLPFVLGQAARVVLKDLVSRNRKKVSLLDRSVIVLIVYASFSNSTASGLWSQISVGMLALVVLLALLLLVLVFAFTTFVARGLGFPLADEVTAVFCGSQKSLANGAPIANILFAGNPGLGMILLPLMVYHQAQLLLCAAFAGRYLARAETTSARPAVQD